MNEIITTIILFVDESLIYWIPALVLIGIAVKHCTRFPNNLIPLVEVGSGAFVGICFGLAKSADAGCFGGVLSLVEYATQGALLGVIAIALYDMVHGIIKEHLSKEENK